MVNTMFPFSLSRLPLRCISMSYLFHRKYHFPTDQSTHLYLEHKHIFPYFIIIYNISPLFKILISSPITTPVFFSKLELQNQRVTTFVAVKINSSNCLYVPACPGSCPQWINAIVSEETGSSNRDVMILTEQSTLSVVYRTGDKLDTECRSMYKGRDMRFISLGTIKTRDFVQLSWLVRGYFHRYYIECETPHEWKHDQSSIAEWKEF